MQMKLLGQIFYKGTSVDCVDFIQTQMNEMNHLTYIDHGQSWKTHKIASALIFCSSVVSP